MGKTGLIFARFNDLCPRTRVNAIPGIVAMVNSVETVHAKA
jgi:hypothetical protein